MVGSSSTAAATAAIGSNRLSTAAHPAISGAIGHLVGFMPPIMAFPRRMDIDFLVEQDPHT
jgi:hypothetical protein